MDEDHEQPKKSHTTLSVVVVVVVLPILYALSFGPVLELTDGSPVGTKFFMLFYRPLIWLIREVSWLEELMSNYLNYWSIP